MREREGKKIEKVCRDVSGRKKEKKEAGKRVCSCEKKGYRKNWKRVIETIFCKKVHENKLYDSNFY